MDGRLGPQIDLGKIARAPIPSWMVDMANAALKLGPDEMLVVNLPRESAHPIWSLVTR